MPTRSLFVLAVLLPITSLAADRPNFLFIITDDQSPETLDCYGDRHCDTPHLDRLAKEGIVLDDAHHMGAWRGAVCTASRTMVMTGRSVWNIPGANGFPKNGRKAAAQQSLPAVFNRAGYDTFRTCKRGNSFAEANALFSVVRDATKRGPTAETGSAWHADQVLEYLDAREQSKDTDPFLIYFGFSHPHDPRNGPDDLVAKYGASNSGPGDAINPKAPPLPVNWLPAHPFHHGHPGLRDEEKVQGVLKRRDVATVRNELGREFACVENIDTQVGRVLDRLRESGQLDNTYVVFTSDHGIAVGRHGLMGKQNLYEHTWRVPFIVRGPGIEPGSRASGYAYLLDVLPTFCDLAGIETPDVVDGKSLRPVLEGESETVRDVLYGVYSGGTKPGMRAVKTDGWKLIEYDVLDGQVRETQLFNVKDNPREFLAEHVEVEVWEAIVAGRPKPASPRSLSERPTETQRNLADDPAHTAKLAKMRDLLASEMKRLGDPYTLSAPK